MLTEAHIMGSSITTGKLTKVWAKEMRTKALATNCIHDFPQTERWNPMCLKAEGENIPWGQKAEEPTMELDSAIACKSICYLVSQGKNSMRKSENERAYGTTHTHKQHWAYPIKLQSNRQQVTNRKKKPYYGRGIFFPYCNLLCRGSGRLQRNADSHCYTKRTAHTCSKTQSNRISSLNYRSSVVALSLSPSSYATVTSDFVIKAHKVLCIPIAPKKVLWIPKTQHMYLSTALRSPEAGMQWLSHDTEIPASGQFLPFPVILV